MRKLLFIGDFNSESQILCLKNFLKKYKEQSFEICISGHNLAKIKDIVKKTPNIVSDNLSSNTYIYYLMLADYVFLFDMQVLFSKYKYSGQHVIRYISEDTDDLNFDVEYDETLIYRNDCLSDQLFPTINDSNNLTFLLLLNSEEDIVKDKNGMIHFLKKIRKDGCNLILGLCSNYHLYCIECNETYRVDFYSVNKFAETVANCFDGVAIYINDQVKTYFEQYCISNNYSFKPEKVLTPEECKLFMVCSDVNALYRTINEGEYSKTVLYRELLCKLYFKNDYSSEKVSVIIPRYNTPFDLLSRAIKSALNCGHENTEVVIIDDGSKDNIEPLIKDSFSEYGNVIKFYYKENEGLGPSRNYGVDKSNGDYIYFLDSDDTVQKGAIPLLLTHLKHFNLPFVAGKRVLCDENGIPINESLRHLYGSTFNIYYNNAYNPSYEDKMVNNKLYVKEFLKDNHLRFVPGYYEDVLFTAELYKCAAQWHEINVRSHNWYQYGKNTSISSSISYDNFKAKLDMLEKSWNLTPEPVRFGRFPFIVKADFNRYYRGFNLFSSNEKRNVFEDLLSFVATKEKYMNRSCFSITEKRLINSLIKQDYDAFEKVLMTSYVDDHDTEPHDNYIISTHYHLVVSIVKALNNKRPSRLFLFKGYNDFNPVLVRRLIQTGVFSLVKVFSNANVKDLMQALDESPDDSDTIIPTYLYPNYASVFKECDMINDNMILFSDSHPYWYYIHREAAHIIKHEDAYNSFDRELRGFDLYGEWGGIQRFIGDSYPKIHYKSERIEKVIVSSHVNNLPANLEGKLIIEDAKLIAESEKDRLKEIFMILYGDNLNHIKEDSVLLLTQPLYLYNYCTKKQQLKLYKKMCSGYDPSKVIVKPHPADNLNYNSLGFKVINKNIPIEVYNYLGVHIKEAVTFGSTAIETITFAEKNTNVFPLHDFEYSEVKPFILNYIKQKKTLWSRAKRKVRKAIFS